MLTPADLYPYQVRGINHILRHPNCMLWEDMGLGKTAQALTAIADLIDRMEICTALVIAPRRICQLVWRQEAKKWSHLQGLTFSLVLGSKAEREWALGRRADIYLVNPENVPWLTTMIKHKWLRHRRYPPFSMVIYDEITKFKNSEAKRSKAWHEMLMYFQRRVGLTGEPASNGYTDLYGQYYVVDEGRRLGKNITEYRERFLRPIGFGGRSWEATNTGKEIIRNRISDITLQLSAEDYLDLPPVLENTVWIDLPDEARKIYDTLEKEFFAELDSGLPIEAPNTAALMTKLLQITSGAIYNVSGGTEWTEIHREKLDALEDVLEESGGQPILCGYGYIHEAQRIALRWPENPQHHTGATFLSSKLGERAAKDVQARWDRDEIPMLCGHPDSMGHGLTLSDGSCSTVVWTTLPWSLELYRQMNARIIGGHRRKRASVVHHILARKTIDELVFERLRLKAETQDSLRKLVQKYREERGL